MIALALLSKVDSSDAAYMDTPGILRIVIYVLAMVAVLDSFRSSRLRLVIFGLYLATLLSITMSTVLYFDAYSIARDLITLLLLFGVLGTVPVASENTVSVRMLTYFSCGLIGAELINIGFFFEAGSEHYLSYDSIKCIVIFASLVALVRGRPVLFLVISLCTLVVLIGYATRMLLLTYIVVLVLLSMSPATESRGKATLVLSVIAGVALGWQYFSQEFVESSRLFSVFYSLADAANWLEYVRVLDPVRFAEHQVFFDRSIWRLTFGDGLGSGFIDQSGLFSFVLPGTGAFSDEELLTARYFRLHDSWIYFGLRLGLVFVFVAFAYFVRAMFSRDKDRALLGALGFLLLNTATFSISGLFMTALIAKSLALTRSGIALRENIA